MSYKKLIQMYNVRKEKLSSLASDKHVNLGSERLLQLKGALGEIEMFISVLEQHEQMVRSMNEDVDVSGIQGSQSRQLLRRGSIFG